MKHTLYSLVIALLLVSTAYAHKGHHHHEEVKLTQPEQDTRESKLNQIGNAYVARIQPIFQKSCFDCHSNQTQYPWYYKVPGVKQLIDSDISESKEHLDFTSGFPFKGHASLEEDLKAIADEIREGDMPPLLYRMLHSKQTLTDENKATILKWISESTTLLDGKPPHSTGEIHK